MLLMLTILTVLAVWAFLTVLVIGLLLILKPLESARGSLEKVAMGVRAIERETQPLGPCSERLAEVVGELNTGLRGASGRLIGVAQGLDAAGPGTRRL